MMATVTLWPAVGMPLTDPATARSVLQIAGIALLVLVGLTFLWLRGRGASSHAVEPIVATSPETGRVEEGGIVGDDRRRLLRRARRERLLDASWGAVDDLRSELREAAVIAEATASGISRERAATAVDRGEWTDDQLAAATLAKPDADVEYPVAHALYVWLLPQRAFEHRVDRTTVAIYSRLDEDDAAASTYETTEREGTEEPADSDNAPAEPGHNAVESGESGGASEPTADRDSTVVADASDDATDQGRPEVTARR